MLYTDIIYFTVHFPSTSNKFLPFINVAEIELLFISKYLFTNSGTSLFCFLKYSISSTLFSTVGILGLKIEYS